MDNIQKKKEQDKEPSSPNVHQQKPGDKPHLSDVQNVNAVTQHVLPAQQLLSPTHGPGPHKEDIKEKSIEVNSTTITIIKNGRSDLNDKEKEYPKNYFTLEPKIEKKDDLNKNSITITRALPKQSPGGQGEKAKVSKANKRPLQCLETLAEKAGITFEDKYEAANTLLALDKQNNSYRRQPDLKQPKTEPDSHNQAEEYRFRNKEEDDKLQVRPITFITIRIVVCCLLRHIYVL